MAVLPTDPLYSRLLVTALKPEYKTVKDSISTIVAMLSVENIFYGNQTFELSQSSSAQHSEKMKNKAIKNRKRLLNMSSDHLSLL